MAKTWRDIFKPEIDEWIGNAVDNTTRTNLYTYVQDGDMALDRAAKRAGMSTADFAESMRNAGYKVPQEVLVQNWLLSHLIISSPTEYFIALILFNL